MARFMMITLVDGQAYRWCSETRTAAIHEGALSKSEEGLVGPVGMPRIFAFLPDSREQERILSLMRGKEPLEFRSSVMLTEPERRVLGQMLSAYVEARESLGIEVWTELGDGELLLLASRFLPYLANVRL
jgi:hypothetical protein